MTLSTTSPQGVDLKREIDTGPRASQEFDLVDLIGFLWRWRRWLLIGTILGASLGAGGSYMKGLSQTKTLTQTQAPSGQVGYQWTAHYAVTRSSESKASQAPSSAIMDFLRTPLGSTTFYEHLNASLSSPMFPLQEWAVRQQSGSGLIASVETDSSDVIVKLESLVPLSDHDIRKALQISLNETIYVFNERFGRPVASLRKENLSVRIQMGELKIAALKIFDQDTSYSQDFKKSFLEGMTKELSQKWSVDAMIVLLGRASLSPQKAELVESYQNYLKRLESLESLEASIAKQSGTEDPAIISPIGLERELHRRDKGDVIEKKPTPLLAKPLTGLVLGGVLGSMFVLVFALMISFYSMNRERFKKLLS